MKKKICSLLFCLFCSVGLWAQITTDNYHESVREEHDKCIDQKISNHLSVHGFRSDDKYLQSLLEIKRSMMETEEIEKNSEVNSKKEKSSLGLAEGDRLIYLMLGAGFSSGRVDGIKWGGEGGLSYGVQAISFLTPRLGLGIEFNGTSFKRAPNDYYNVEDWTTSYYNSTTSVKVITNNIMMSGRFNFMSNLNDKVNLYIPFGVGIGFAQVSMRYASNYGSGEMKEETKGEFTYFLGLGVESKIEENTFFALEARFNQQRIDLKDLDIKSSARYVNVLAKIGWKF